MSTIDKHVDVQISKETATVSRVGFGTPAILTYHTRFAEIYRLYGSLDEMTTDGFVTSDLAYKLAAAMFAQSPRPQQIVVGRRATAAIRDVRLTPKSPLLPSTAYDIRINGELMDYSTDATPTLGELCTGIETAVNSGAQNVDADGSSATHVDIEAADAPGGSATAGPAYTIQFDPLLWDFEDNTADASADTDLNTLLGATTNFYGLVIDLWDATNIVDVATAVASASTPKIFIAETQDTDVIESGSSDVASLLAATSNDRAAIVYHYDIDPSPAAAWLGLQLPTTPGATTWKFKTLQTVSAAELTTGQIALADGKYCNTYVETGGINITAEGVMSSSEFIDVTRFVDWLTARIKENVFRALAINPKIPYTNAGIQAIVSEVEGVLRQGIFNGGINPDEDLIVSAPLASEVDANDRASRILPDITFIATLAGAIHKTVIRGKVVA